MRYGPARDHMPQLRLSVAMDERDDNNIIVRHASELDSKTIPLYSQATDQFIDACSEWFSEAFKRFGGQVGAPALQARVEFYAPGPQRYTTTQYFDSREVSEDRNQWCARQVMHKFDPLLRYFAGMEMPIIDPVHESMWMFKKRTWRQKWRLCWWILKRM